MRVDRFFDLTEELKPESEIKRILADACVIKSEDPNHYYSIGSKIGQGAQSVVYKVVRNEDYKVFALKLIEINCDEARQDILNECRLMMHLHCEQLIRCEEVYEYANQIWVILEYMEDESMTDLVLSRQGDFAEDFVRWSLYQVALGLHAMHAQNVLHRDLKSDNVLVRTNGVVKIADMGFSVFLTKED